MGCLPAALRTRLRCSEFYPAEPFTPLAAGIPGDRHLTGGYWPPDHGDLSASAADRQRGGVCCRRNDLLPAVGGYRGARNAADVQQSRPHLPPCWAWLQDRSPDDAMLRYRAAFARGMACGGRWTTPGMPATSCRPGHCRLRKPRADFLSQDRMTMNELIPLIVLSCLLAWRQMPEPSPPPAYETMRKQIRQQKYAAGS